MAAKIKLWFDKIIEQLEKSGEARAKDILRQQRWRMWE